MKISLLLGLAAANTENLVFEVRELFAPEENDVMLTTSTPFKGIANETTKVFVNADQGRHLCRVCWPASEPAEFKLEYVEPYILVHAHSYAVPVDKNAKPQKVHYELVLSRMIYGIPMDVISIVFTVVCAAIAGIFLAYYLFWH